MKINDLYTTILERKANPTAASYTAHLFDAGADEIIKKVGEEAIEVIIAANNQGKERLIEEISDLTYHVLVLMALHHITPDDILGELEKRHK
ncbi:MAG: phosphoribosyl-ATP diphosphatase [Leptolinea sp.]|jgi:phosphoribosyl-ATP pyrophosphohydrolase|nr:phosphoribosyl-ATP diphosphatase [Leptolinea sp.]